VHASFPSPSEGVIHLGPFPLRAYALFILIGIAVSIVTAERRMQARGYRKGLVADIAVWAVPFGIVGGRLYHVITDNQLYFRKGRDPVQALEIWHGGLGIWGAISLGALGAYIGARRNKDEVRFSDLADALAPGIPLAQGIGRLGNYFNQELYGRPSGLPWAVEIDPAHREARYADVATYQPTFLYELLWDFGTAGLVIWAERRFKLGLGRAFALYVAIYCVGRFWIEALRIDEAHKYLGLRLNDYTAIVLFLLSVAYIVLRRPRNDAERTETDSSDVDDAEVHST
jgi:prolipoprotein diacylglyceryl transferase